MNKPKDKTQSAVGRVSESVTRHGIDEGAHEDIFNTVNVGLRLTPNPTYTADLQNTQSVGRVSSIERNPTERSPKSPERVDVGLRCANPTYEAGV
jgi:hypothetical protein